MSLTCAIERVLPRSCRSRPCRRCPTQSGQGRYAPHRRQCSTKEDYYAQLLPRFAPLMFNLRSDPFESYDSKDSYGQMIQKNSWISGSMGELIGAHLKTLAEYPPVQQARSFDRSNLVQEFLQGQKKMH